MENNFKDTVLSIDRSITRRITLQVLQVNLGNMCNQECIHCHIDASSKGSKIMSKEIMDDIIVFLTKAKGLTIDITGGCPELNPNFKYFVERSKQLVQKVIVRNNLTVFFERNMEYLPEFYRNNEIKLVCSMPCYTKDNVDKQRGEGVFDKSIQALKMLNQMGYGKELELDLVYNPGGAFLPADQNNLEKDYKKVLYDEHGIVFNNLLTITNMPINRFKKFLESTGDLDEYTKLLTDNFNRDVAGNIMCRNLLSVGWDGISYDCDFNQALDLAIRDRYGNSIEIKNLNPDELEGKEIIFEDHCYSCTAGTGSSCSGALNI